MINKVMFHIHSLGKGGAERVVVTLAAEMVRRGIEVSIATAETEAVEYSLPEGVERIDIGVTGEELRSLGAERARKLRQGRLHRALLERRPDVLYSLCRGANYRAVLASRGTGVPTIISVRSTPEVDYGSWVHKHYSRYLYRKAAGAIFQTEAARAYFPPAIADRATVILNPISPALTQRHPAAVQRRPLIVAVGRVTEAKDYMTLLKAYERVLAAHPEMTLEIYGKTGSVYYYQVLEWVRAHHMTERVRFMGSRSDVLACIEGAACYVLSSAYEGMPNALMEAMALGLPVVATDCPCGGPAALIEDGVNGLLAEVGNDKELAAAICKMLDHPGEAERAAAAARQICERAPVERIASEWLAYAEKVKQ